LWQISKNFVILDNQPEKYVKQSAKNYMRFFRQPAVIIFLVSVLAKTIFGFAVVTEAERIISDPDAIGYFRLAENLRHHGVFSRSEEPPFAPDSVLTPVYPFFVAVLLALAGGKLWIIPVAQGLVNSLSAALVFKAGEKLFGTRAGFIAGLCFALDPSALVRTFSLLTESVFTFLFLAAIFFLVQYVRQPSTKALISSAALLGVAALCRPVALYFFVPAAAILFFVNSGPLKIRARNAAIYLAVFALTLSPWLMRNKLIFGAAQLTSIQGINLLLMNAAFLKAAQEHIDYATAEQRLEAEADSLMTRRGITANKISLTYKGKQYGYQLNDPRASQVYQELAMQKILASPLLYGRVHLTGIIPSFLDTSVRDFYHFAGKERPMFGWRAWLVTGNWSSTIKNFWSRTEPTYLVLYLLNLGWLVVHYALAFIAIVRPAKEKSYVPLVLLLLPLFYLLFVAAPAGSERFRFPAMPYFYLLSASALMRISWRKSKCSG
jgi:4-amino-4-deoxy-L-arabinose transferase-like glycosyltransferase